MKFATLQKRVQRAERLVEGRSAQSRASWIDFRHAWREGWTPWRIVGAGLIAGFFAGRAEPLSFAGKLGSVRWMELLGSVSTLFAQVSAAEAAQRAVDDAEPTEPAPQAPPRPAPHAPAAAAPLAPRPAEAATELSEH